MPRTHLSSHTLLLWLSLSVATPSALLGVACSSSDDTGTSASSAGKGGGHTGGAKGTAGNESNSEAGETSTGGVPDDTDGPDDSDAMSEGGRGAEPSGGGSGGTLGSTGGQSATGGSTSTGEAGETGETGEGGAGGSPDAVDPEITAAQARAVALISDLSPPRRCTTCHDVTYRGSGFFPNITPDVATGIGSWDEDDIKVAIRDAQPQDRTKVWMIVRRQRLATASSDKVLKSAGISEQHRARQLVLQKST